MSFDEKWKQSKCISQGVCHQNIMNRKVNKGNAATDSQVVSKSALQQEAIAH